jgi:hypothetical protein
LKNIADVAQYVYGLCRKYKSFWESAATVLYSTLYLSSFLSNLYRKWGHRLSPRSKTQDCLAFVIRRYLNRPPFCKRTHGTHHASLEKSKIEGLINKWSFFLKISTRGIDVRGLVGTYISPLNSCAAFVMNPSFEQSKTPSRPRTEERCIIQFSILAMIGSLAKAINARELLPPSFLLLIHDCEMRLIFQKRWDYITCVCALVRTLNQDQDVECPSSQNAKPTHLCRTRSFLKSKIIITSSHEIELISKKVYRPTKCRDFLKLLREGSHVVAVCSFSRKHAKQNSQVCLTLYIVNIQTA